MDKIPTSTSPRHPIGVVARRTGLKPDLIRAWERRYRAVEPGRSSTRRRFYSDADVERLLLLRQAIQTGRGIGQVAALSNEDLMALVAEEPAFLEQQPLPSLPEHAGEVAEPYLSLCLAATQRLDVRDLEMQIERASVALSRTQLMERLLVPLMHHVGDLWHQGSMRPVHEHMTSAVVRSFLGGMRGAYHPETTAPRLIVTTPARQHHELGALVAAATAAVAGWQVTYLGPDLPPEEIAAAALQKGARAVALSVTYPPDDPLLADDLKKLKRMLLPRTELLVGGRAADSYARTLEEIAAYRVDSLDTLREVLEELRFRRLGSDGNGNGSGDPAG